MHTDESISRTGAGMTQSNPDRITGEVKALYRYPVSSLGGERLAAAAICDTGIEDDRGYGFFDAETAEHIYPARDARWNAAARFFARIRGGTVQISTDGANWHDCDAPQILAEIATLLGRRVDLRRYDTGHRPRYNVAPLHLLSVQAMDSLRRRLPGAVLDERRFRPNILLDMPSADDIPEYALIGQEFTLGAVRLRGMRPCVRCAFTTLEIEDLPEDASILRTLNRTFERNFGIYCEVVAGGTLSLGDRLDAARAAPSIDPVVIVGGGQAGAAAARALRRLGYAGAIRIYGAERHLPYDRPPLSKRIAARAPVSVLLTAAEAEDRSITLHLDTAVDALDIARRRIEATDGTETGFGTLILATGGRARRIAGVDRGHGRVHVLRTIEDADRLSSALASGGRLFVCGGGWIGMETAAAARAAGMEVTLFARGTALAPRILPAVVADHLARLHNANGVTLRFGIEPRFRESADGITATLGAQVLHADHLVIAAGMVASDGLARRAGLACADGVLTDVHGATGTPGVYAIGDLARQPSGRIESWQNANLQAERAARHILGIAPPTDEPLQFWSDQFGHRLQIVGNPDPQAAPLSAQGTFWDFGRFAVGIDTPKLIHSAARRLAHNGPSAPAAPAAKTVARREHPLCPAANIPEAALVRIDHDRGPLAVTRQNGQVFATDDGCPHSVASLSQGFIEEGRIVCPLHFAEFGLTDGRPHNAPPDCGHLTVHPVIERDGHLFVLLPTTKGNAG